MMAESTVQNIEHTVENIGNAIGALAKVDWVKAAEAFKGGVSNPTAAIAEAENVASAVVGAVAIVDPGLGATLAGADAVGSSFLRFLSKFIP